jgi:hypothetical protein
MFEGQHFLQSCFLLFGSRSRYLYVKMQADASSLWSLIIELLYAPDNEDVMGSESMFHYHFYVDTHGDEKYPSRCGHFYLGTHLQLALGGLKIQYWQCKQFHFMLGLNCRNSVIYRRVSDVLCNIHVKYICVSVCLSVLPLLLAMSTP